MVKFSCEEGISIFTEKNMLICGLCFIMTHTDNHWVHLKKSKSFNGLVVVVLKSVHKF